jgi:hypothetical protein
MPAPPKSATSSSKKSKKSKPKPKTSTAVVAAEAPPDPAAVNQVFDWIVAGHSEHNIQESVAAHFPGHPLESLLNGAWSRLLKTAKAPREVILAWCIESTRACHQKSFELGDFPASMRAIMNIATLADRLTRPETDDEGDSQGGE